MTAPSKKDSATRARWVDFKKISALRRAVSVRQITSTQRRAVLASLVFALSDSSSDNAILSAGRHLLLWISLSIFCF